MSYGPLRTHLTCRRRIVIEGRKCVGCKLCMRNCPVGTPIAYSERARKAYLKDPLACGGCGACLRGCPAGAIHIAEERLDGGIVGPRAGARAPGQPKEGDPLRKDHPEGDIAQSPSADRADAARLP